MVRRTGRWRRKYEVDAEAGLHLPVPTRVVSNEEFIPLPQTQEQAQVEWEIQERAQQHASALGMTRRQFLGTASGMATAFLAMNTVFGRFFDVEPVEAAEPAAAHERWPKNLFIFDIQTHHVAAPRQFPWLLRLRRSGRLLNPALEKDHGTMEDLYLENYIKEVFLDSQTTMALISGISSETDADNILPPGKIAETREVINRLASSQRVLSHGLISPNKGPRDLDEMRRQREELKVDAWKGYTGLRFGSPRRAWRVDDEQVAYPTLELSRKLRVRNICLHKGLPLNGDDEAWHPRDILKSATDFPDLNFIIYHSGFKSLASALPTARDEFRTTSRVDWVTDLCEMRRLHPKLTNVYMELGTTFAQLVISSPLLSAHVLGMIIQAFGTDHVLWGTDSIWWGSPQWQIEAFRRFQMPDALMARFGYQALTIELKEKIFGLNAARLFGVDPTAHRNPVPPDYVSRLRKAYQEEGAEPSLTQYGWVFSA